ncbi:MAG: hypothetical protein ABH838_03715 [Actinomycetota bacterium]
MNLSERRNFLLIVAVVMVIVFAAAVLALGLDIGYSAIFKRSYLGGLTLGGPAVEKDSRRSFYIFDFSRNKEIPLEMVCARLGRYSVIYKEPDLAVSDSLLDRIRVEFDEDIYPVVGGPLAPSRGMGLDGETRVTILLLKASLGEQPGTSGRAYGGYYSSANEQLGLYREKSNEAKIIHIFITQRSIDEDHVLELVAHETRHLKNWAMTKTNTGYALGGLFAAATVMTLYLGLSRLYIRSFLG